MGIVRFFIDPSWTDQEIFDRIEGIKDAADSETEAITLPGIPQPPSSGPLLPPSDTTKA